MSLSFLSIVPTHTCMQRGRSQDRDADRLSLQAQGAYSGSTTVGLNIKLYGRDRIESN